MTNTKTTEPLRASANKGLAKVAAQCFEYTFMVNQKLVLRNKIYAKKPAHRKSTYFMSQSMKSPA